MQARRTKKRNEGFFLTEQPFKPDVPLGMPQEPKTPERLKMEADLRKGEVGLLPKEPLKERPSFEVFCDDVSFKPAKMAAILKDHYNLITDIETDVLYFYNNSLYSRNGDMILRGLISYLLGENSNPSRTKNTIYELHSQTIDVIPECKLIALENGYFDVKTRKLIEPTPTEFVTLKCPVRYDPNAKCPANEKFLSEVLEPDQKPIALEFIGYCLLQEQPLNASLVLLGEGANGKSTFLNLVAALLGPENVSHATLQQLCNGKFELAELKGKLANICDDLPGDSLKSVGNFKNLTGNAPIQAQFKYGKPFDFWNTAKMLWACNKLPPASEDTIAFYRRFIILNFDKIFIGKDVDTNLLEKLTTPEELSGLLNLALGALQRLLENRVFSHSKSIEETRKEYIRTADSTQAFLEEMTEISDSQEDYVREDVLYSRYIAYCSYHKLPKQRKANLTISMQKIRPEAQRSQIRIGKKQRPRVWQFLKIVENVTGVTTVTGDISLGNFREEKLKEKKEGCDIRDSRDTSRKVCGQCFNFRMPSCESKDNWEERNGNAEALTNWCFKPRNYEEAF
jgi:putative DNA primase/helicase